MTGVQTIDFPHVQIGGKRYTLKFDFTAQYSADSMGLDPAAAVKAFADAENRQPGKLVMLVKLFAAMVAHQYIEANEPVPSPDSWALRLSKEPMEVHKALGEAVVQAILKALPGPKTETQAPAEPATAGAPN